ncbi:MAG: hypothetical protein A2942_00670 [Candidatus Lloydbacteria bacterium RIFCSPLOWO2_01_FULL_50_20]|uniref:Vitamin K epoxide reductase domain-containing protein n=1 Tax=Candidatus Lloydbacteria bacterium RIFCSPLOWO2_01_FULL_50_20 TaxID=1798665 RepID=A0A1G2DH92_9BACT|nr:MAG: hypothetical protein A2942_00670 [Candidatus Lloydbacteria bacterium RIFCSPLOWO2_01_FULL_50_20]
MFLFMNMKNPTRIILITLSILGIFIMAYLVKVGYGSGDTSFCDLGEGLSCDLVNKSKYAKVFGIPLSGMGLAYFIWVFFTALRSYKPKSLEKIALVSVVMLVPSLYLSIWVEYFVLETFCILCEASKVIMALIIIASLFALRPKPVPWKRLFGSIVVGSLLIGISYISTSSSDPGKKYDEFAQCLTSKHYVMLGSATCSSCLKQRDMFGEAMRFIEEIECDPRNADNAQEKEEVKFCANFQIRKTPTWVQLDEARNSLYRFDAGIQSFDSLSSVSGCPLPAEQ